MDLLLQTVEYLGKMDNWIFGCIGSLTIWYSADFKNRLTIAGYNYVHVQNRKFEISFLIFA
jgi:hypothetical protein